MGRQRAQTLREERETWLKDPSLDLERAGRRAHPDAKLYRILILTVKKGQRGTDCYLGAFTKRLWLARRLGYPVCRGEEPLGTARVGTDIRYNT